MNGQNVDSSDENSKDKKLSSEPSTSKTVKPTIVIRKAPKIVDVKKESSSDSSDNSSYEIMVPSRNSRNRELDSDSNENGGGKETVSNTLKEILGVETSPAKVIVNEEAVELSFVDQVAQEEVVNFVEEPQSNEKVIKFEDDYEEEEEESEEQDDDSDLDFDPSCQDDKPARKTVKCIYPKRRVPETDSENSKENVINGRRGARNSNARLNGRTVNGVLPQEKRPLRQTTRKNLAEDSSEGSEADVEAPPVYKTRGVNQRTANGLSVYAESGSSDEEDVDVEDRSEESKDNDSEAYQPRPSMRQKRRQESSDSAASRSLRGRKVLRASKQTDSEVTSDEGPIVSISSRGRVRKQSRRVRALLRD